MSEVTQLLARAGRGEVAALDQVFVLLYDELRYLAQARVHSGERTLTPTALVNEAYLRLLGGDGLQLNDRHHFFACAARAMRMIVVDHIRHASASKRGGGGRDVDIDAVAGSASDFPEDMLALDAALDHLDAVNPRQRQVIELHYFGGLDYPEIARLLECSERTAKREWQRGRAFLYARMTT